MIPGGGISEATPGAQRGAASWSPTYLYFSPRSHRGSACMEDGLFFNSPPKPRTPAHLIPRVHFRRHSGHSLHTVLFFCSHSPCCMSITDFLTQSQNQFYEQQFHFFFAADPASKWCERLGPCESWWFWWAAGIKTEAFELWLRDVRGVWHKVWGQS